MLIQDNIPIGRKTTMKIGGTARYFVELKTKEDVEEAVKFATEKNIPLIPLGAGSNTVFADGSIEALVVQVKAEKTETDENTVRVEAGKYLATLINELAALNLDLSPLTGIPGTIGGALFGNAGQGPKGVWLDSFVRDVTVFRDGKWQTLNRDECHFEYRESVFKKRVAGSYELGADPILWSTTLEIPSGSAAEIKAEVERLLKKRIETQPHLKTAGSCFKAIGAKPAWQLIDQAGLRGAKVGDVQIAEKHANFLLNTGKATYADAKEIVQKVKDSLPQQSLEVEMRFIENSGKLAF